MVWNNLLCSIGVLSVLLSLSVWPANVQAACSEAYGEAYINEFNTKSGYVEVYFSPSAPAENYVVRVWNVDGYVDQSFPYDQSTYWVYRVLSNIDNNDNFDITLYDSDGDVVDYINVHISQGNNAGDRSYYNSDYENCDAIRDSVLNDEGSPHLIERNNSGQRQFYRTTDGGEIWEETNQNKDKTYGESNDGTDPLSLHHIHIEHDGAGLTCMAETVTILACTDADCTPYPGEVTVELTSPTSGWAPDPVTFSGGSVTVELRYTTQNTVTLDAEATSPTAENVMLCTNSSGGADCEMAFTDVGVLIDGDDSDAIQESNIGSQIASKPSNVAPPEPALQQRVRVVRTDDETGACVAGVGNETLDATFRYLVPVADGLSNNTVAVTGNTNADLTSAGSGATVQLAFDGNGTAPFHFGSVDAGRYSLRVDLEIPVIDANGDPTGDTIPATDTSNPFVVRPLALFADATGNPRAQSAAGNIYKKAGEAFPLTFKALRWSSGRDTNNDGLWDSCGDTNLADPGNYARVPVWTIGQPAAVLVLPAGGSNPDFSYGDGNVGFVAGESEATAINVSYGEVGIVQLQANGMNTFFGENVQVCSPYIGRFTPYRFTVADNTPQFDHACGTFTYVGQEFDFLVNPILTITALGVGGNVVGNYGGSFWKYPGDLTGRNYIHAGTETVTVSATTTGSTDLSGDDDYDGKATIEIRDERLTYQKPNAAIGPFDTLVDLNVTIADLTDSDGVCHDADDDGTCEGYTIADIGNSEQRYGRMLLQNAYGPETRPLTIPVQTEYYTGSAFTLNDADSCTVYNSTDLSPPSPISVGDGQTIASGSGTLISGESNDIGTNSFLSLSAPDHDGSVDLELDLYEATGLNQEWLQFDWDGDASNDNPTAKATFGIFQGNQSMIYMRESIW